MAMQEQAFTVKAYDHSANNGTGSGLTTNITLQTGDQLSITANPNDAWSAGGGNTFISNAGGQGYPFGSQLGYNPITIKNLAAPLGSLVGSIDGGSNYFLIGINYESSDLEGDLVLYFWDTNYADNSGSVNAVVKALRSRSWVLSMSLESEIHLEKCNNLPADKLQVSVTQDGASYNRSWQDLLVEEADSIKWNWTGNTDTSFVGLLSKDFFNQRKISLKSGTLSEAPPPCGLWGNGPYFLADGNEVSLEIQGTPRKNQLIVDYIIVFKTKDVGYWYCDPEVCMDPASRYTG